MSMWNYLSPRQIVDTGIPGLYETEHISLEDKLIYLHYFMGSADWYMAEYCPVDNLFFGYANLGDPDMAEWGYVSHDEIRRLMVGPGIQVDRDVFWRPRRVGEIPGIRI